MAFVFKNKLTLKSLKIKTIAASVVMESKTFHT